MFSNSLVLTSPGNHEIEPNVDIKKWGYGPNMNSTFSNLTFAGNFYEYQSYSARFPNGQMAQSLFGDINSNMYYSVNAGGIHILTLNTLIPYQPGTPQYDFAVTDLAAVNRVLTVRGGRCSNVFSIRPHAGAFRSAVGGCGAPHARLPLGALSC